MNEMTELNFADPLDWVYEVRHRISLKYGNDITRYMKAVAEKTRQEKAEGRVFASLPIVRSTPSVVQ